MTPLRPSSASSTTAHSKKTVPRTGTRTSYPARKPTASLADSKRDKRQVKHSLLVSRAAQSSKADGGGIRRRELKRRRTPASKGKLNADLSALLDTLPDTEAKGAAGSSAVAVSGKALNVTIASKPGAQKKKERIAQAERERMGRNLAAMAAGGAAVIAAQESPAQAQDAEAAGSTAASLTDKWAAIRRHIAQSMAG